MMISGRAELHDIKKATPNPRLVAHLKDLLEDAESGEIQGLLYVASHNDSYVSNGWIEPFHNNSRRVIGELCVMQADLQFNVNISDPLSATSRQLTGDTE